MLNVIRRSQMIGLTTMDRNTAKGYGKVEEVWVDSSGRVSYVSSDEGYFPIDEVATVGSDGVLTYSFTGINSPNDPLSQLNRMAVRTQRGHDPIGWIEDFLFDWETGDKNAVQEATEFLQDQWQDLQNRVTRAGNRMKKALDKAWKRLTNQR